MAGIASRAGYGAARAYENVMRAFIAVELPDEIREGLSARPTRVCGLDEHRPVGACQTRFTSR